MKVQGCLVIMVEDVVGVNERIMYVQLVIGK